jgi:hypothetical protein
MFHFRLRQAQRQGGFADLDDAQNPTPSDKSDDNSHVSVHESNKSPSNPSQDKKKVYFQSPSHTDVHAVRAVLVSHLRMPMELADMIIDFAEYFPSIISRLSDPITCVARAANNYKAASLALLSEPVPMAQTHDELVRVRSVKFTITSADQGWGGERPDTYMASYSWFSTAIYRPRRGLDDPDASLENQSDRSSAQVPRNGAANNIPQYVPNPDLDVRTSNLAIVVPDDRSAVGGTNGVWKVQSNLVGHRTPILHEIEWFKGQRVTERDRHHDGGEDGVGFVELLQPGDQIGLYAEAEFPGWRNEVKAASIEIKYSI